MNIQRRVKWFVLEQQQGLRVKCCAHDPLNWKRVVKSAEAIQYRSLDRKAWRQ